MMSERSGGMVSFRLNQDMIYTQAIMLLLQVGALSLATLSGAAGGGN